MWPPAEGLSTQNVSRKDAVLTSIGSAQMHAPAPLVFTILREVGRYGEWNSFAPKVTVQDRPVAEDGQLEIGTAFTLNVLMDSKKPDSFTPTPLKVTDISTPETHSSYIPTAELESDPSYSSNLNAVYRICWKLEGGWTSRGLKTERFHEVIVLSKDECEVRTWENQGGLLARTVKWLYQKTLNEKFTLWCEDLKKYAEQKCKEDVQQP